MYLFSSTVTSTARSPSLSGARDLYTSACGDNCDCDNASFDRRNAPRLSWALSLLTNWSYCPEFPRTVTVADPNCPAVHFRRRPVGAGETPRVAPAPRLLLK